MSIKEGAFGCMLPIKPFETNPRLVYSSNPIVNAALSQFQDYHIVKAFKVASEYTSEKANHKKVMQYYNLQAGLSAEKNAAANEVQSYILSLYGVDILPDLNYTLKGDAVPDDLTAASGWGGKSYYCPGGRSGALPTQSNNELAIVVMRKLGRSFYSTMMNPKDNTIANGQAKSYSAKVFLNFIQKVYLLNTNFIQFDLHAGNLLFTPELREFIIVDMGLGHSPSSTFRYANPGNAIWYRGLEDHPDINVQDALFKNILNTHTSIRKTGTLPSFWKPLENGYRSTFNIWDLLWSKDGEGGEMASLLKRNQEGQLNILVNATVDLYAISLQLYAWSHFFECSKFVRLFTVLFSWPNPFLRPYSFNVVKLLSKLIKLESDKKITLKAGGTQIVSFESRIGIGKEYDLLELLTYRSTYVYDHPESYWQTDDVLKRFAKFNYYAMCWQIVCYGETIAAMTTTDTTALLSLKNLNYKFEPKYADTGYYYFDSRNSEDEKWRSLFSRRKMEAYLNQFIPAKLKSLEIIALNTLAGILSRQSPLLKLYTEAEYSH